MMKMDLDAEIGKRVKEIEDALLKYLPEPEGYQGVVMEAMRYAALAGGKRLRPMLMLETYRMFGGTGAVVEPFMAAIEMIHTYSLVHDDLPAMDDDDYRRGKKTAHKVYGEAMAILAGDALLNYAFETALQAFSHAGANEGARIAAALQTLAKKAGLYGMLGGQVIDVQNEDNPQVDAPMLETIYRLKTGALIEASMMIGAMLAGAKEREIRILEQAAGQVGLAFQIQDDILDLTGTTEELGKPVGSDEKNKKVTYVSMYGIDAAKKQVEKLSQEAAAGMDSLPVQNQFLHDLLLRLIWRRS